MENRGHSLESYQKSHLAEGQLETCGTWENGPTVDSPYYKGLNKYNDYGACIWEMKGKMSRIGNSNPGSTHWTVPCLMTRGLV